MPPILHPKAQKLLEENPFSVMNNPEPTSSTPTPTPKPPPAPVNRSQSVGLSAPASAATTNTIAPTAHRQAGGNRGRRSNPFMISLDSNVDLMPLNIL